VNDPASTACRRSVSDTAAAVAKSRAKPTPDRDDGRIGSAIAANKVRGIHGAHGDRRTIAR
jgi:hypothetical protein